MERSFLEFQEACALLAHWDGVMSDDQTWITTGEAAELTGYAPAHIRRLIKGGRVKGEKFGRDWMVNREALLEYKRQMEGLGTDKHDPWRTGARQRAASCMA